MEAELLRSAKDQAELNMIIDLERNDLGRVCEIGSVKVTQPRTIEAHPTVYHGVATVEGRLRPDVGFLDLLRAAFPGGSITGAPKIRAMEIIEELEPTRRGPYCGAIGYLSADGHVEFNVAIRTMILKDGLVHVPVGGGIVADSEPADEYEETLVKARAMFAALGISAGPLWTIGVFAAALADAGVMVMSSNRDLKSTEWQFALPASGHRTGSTPRRHCRA
jgi:anthranilate/para-aminobenzoate synthase component I